MMETLLGIELTVWWYLVIGATFTAYAVLDGFDLGAGMLHLFLRKEESRRIALNAVGPVWDGNEVWLVITGGALFAGFPAVYASAFSAFYIPFMLLLFSLIGRAISIEFRSKEPMKWWRKFWDVSYFLASFLISLLLGVALGNVLQGIAIDANGTYQGTFFDFLNPYALLTGVTVVALYALHGALYLTMKTEGRLFAKVTLLVRSTMIFFLVAFGLLSVSTLIFFPEFTDHMREQPWLFALPVLIVLALANIPRLVRKRNYGWAFIMSTTVTALLLMLVFLQQFPILLPSSIDPAFNLTVENAASSMKTLRLLLTITAIGAPLTLIYFFIVYKTFYGKVKLDDMSY